MGPDFLGGVRVLDASIWRPGPYATSLLVALGAEVLKVEPPGGDPMRLYPELFASVNAGKRSIVLDLKRDTDRDRARELAAEADVLVEGFRPGVMDRLGLGVQSVHAINPSAVYCSISGYGHHGDRAQLPGHDLNYQAWAGSLSPEGQRAQMPPLPVADLASGMAAAFGVCAALLGRTRTGRGAFLDVAMTDVMATWTGWASATDSSAGRDTSAMAVPGYGLFEAADGAQIALGVVNEPHFWSALCDVLGLGDSATLSFAERHARGVELNARIGEAVVSRDADELTQALQAANVPAAPVLSRAALLGADLLPPFPMRITAAAPDAPHGAPADPQRAEVPTLGQHGTDGFGPRRTPDTESAPR